MNKIFFSSIFAILNITFSNVEAMRSESPSDAKWSAEKRAEVTKPKLAAPRRMPTGSAVNAVRNESFVNFDGSVRRNDSHSNGVCSKKLRGIPQPDLSRFRDEKQQLPVESAQCNIQHIYAEDCKSSEQMVIRAVGVGRCNAVAQNQVIHLGAINLTTFLEILRDLGQKYTISAEKIYADYTGSAIHLEEINLAMFLRVLCDFGQKYTISAEKIYADCSGVEKDVFDEIFGYGMHEASYVKNPERFLDCILSGNEFELSAQEDLRQELMELGWSDDSAKNCKVVLNWPDDLQYEYKSANPRLERVIQ